MRFQTLFVKTLLTLTLLAGTAFSALKVTNNVDGMQAGEPWSSILDALVDANDGDTIYVYDDVDVNNPAIDTVPVVADGTISTINGLDIMPSPEQVGPVVLQGSGSGQGIKFTWNSGGPYNVRFHNITVTGWDDGVYVSGRDYIVFVGCTFVSNADYGVQFGDNHLFLTNCMIYSNGGHGLRVGTKTRAVSNSVFMNTYHGIYGLNIADCSLTYIAGNRVWSNFQNGMQLDGYNSHMINLTIESNTVESNKQFGIELKACSNVTVLGNTIRDSWDGNTWNRRGVVLGTSGGSGGGDGIKAAHHCIVASNTISGMGRGGVYVDKVFDNTIRSNTFFDIDEVYGGGVSIKNGTNTLILSNFMYNCRNGVYAFDGVSPGTKVIGNRITGTTIRGLYFVQVPESFVVSNVITNNSREAVYLEDTYNTVIGTNTMYSNGLANGDAVIRITGGSSYGNRVVSNDCYYAERSMVRIDTGAYDNVVDQNLFNRPNDSTGNVAIISASNNKVYSNYIASNQTTRELYLDTANENEFIGNLVVAKDNVVDIARVWQYAPSNRFLENVFENGRYGMEFWSGTGDPVGNEFIGNTFSNIANAVNFNIEGAPLFLSNNFIACPTNFLNIRTDIQLGTNFYGTREWAVDGSLVMGIWNSTVAPAPSHWFLSRVGLNGDFDVPASPTSLTGTFDLTDKEVRLSWDAVGSAGHSVKIFRRTEYNYSNVTDGDLVYTESNPAIGAWTNTTNDANPISLGNTYYYYLTTVDDNGNESWYSITSGIQVLSGDPVASNASGPLYASVQDAVDAANNGDTIYILDDVTEGVSITTVDNLVITTTNATAFRPTLSSNGSGKGIEVDYSSSGIIVSNLIIEGFNQGIMVNGDNCTIAQCHAMGNTAEGIKVNADNTTVISNTVTTNGDRGIELTGGCLDTYIALNTVVSNAYANIYVFQADNTTVVSNIVVNAPETGIQVAGYNTDWATNNVVAYNDVTEAVLFGITVEQALDTTVEHNSVSKITKANPSSVQNIGIRVLGNLTNTVIRYNAIGANVTNGIYLTETSHVMVSNNIITNVDGRCIYTYEGFAETTITMNTFSNFGVGAFFNNSAATADSNITLGFNYYGARDAYTFTNYLGNIYALGIFVTEWAPAPIGLSGDWQLPETPANPTVSMNYSIFSNVIGWDEIANAGGDFQKYRVFRTHEEANATNMTEANLIG